MCTETDMLQCGVHLVVTVCVFGIARQEMRVGTLICQTGREVSMVAVLGGENMFTQTSKR